MVSSMLQIRVEGDPAESQALLDVLAAAGVEVQVGTRKRRAEGFTHTYAVARLDGWTALAGTGPVPETGSRPPYRTRAYVEQAALPGSSRPARRRPR